MGIRHKALYNDQQRAGPVIYWMDRDKRVDDNWALLYAQNKAIELKQPLVVVFLLFKESENVLDGHFAFLINGLIEVKEKLSRLNIPFIYINKETKDIIRLIKTLKAGVLVTDFCPLRFKREATDEIINKAHIEALEVDAHNIVPYFVASTKQEYGAYTIRPKIHKKLDEYLTSFPEMMIHPFSLSKADKAYSDESFLSLPDKKTNQGIKSGESAARESLNDFILTRLSNYNNRNNPNEEATSSLSSFINFGQISAQRIALEVLTQKQNTEDFLEELIVRRELSDNFCYYNKNYDNVNGFPNWAKETLEAHKNDLRRYRYTLFDLENAKTHDKLWNAAQMQMVKTGVMHGYLRMYWAKKILEWTNDYIEAFNTSIYLNDKYQLDGRDPNGYTGIAWSIGGLHDRAWGERGIFGKIRYMAYDGCKRKFDIEKYINKIESL